MHFGRFCFRILETLALSACTLLGAGCMRAVEKPPEMIAPDEDAATPLSRYATWPADGEAHVPTGLRQVLIAADSKFVESITLHTADGEIAINPRAIECDGRFPDAAHCVALDVDLTSVQPGHLTLVYQEEAIATFAVSDEPLEPLNFVVGSCGVFEEAIGSFCLDRDDRSALLYGALNRSVHVEVRELGQTMDEALAPGGRVRLEFDLRGRCERAIELRFRDLLGEELKAELLLEPHRRLPELHLVESLADPFGPEPAQEYITLYNAGREPIRLDGYRLSDSPARAGDAFPNGLTIAPRARALVVSDLYDPAFPGEPHPPPATPILRLSGSLTANGLANQGEPLFLLDPSGRRVSSMPRIEVGEGRCLIAHSIENRRPDPDRFFIGECRAGRP